MPVMLGEYIGEIEAIILFGKKVKTKGLKMNIKIKTGLVIINVFCILPPIWIQAQQKIDSDIEKKAGAPSININELNISDKTLKLCYVIKNDSEKDIWICDDISLTLKEPHFEAYMAEDKQTLLIRKRLDIPFMGLSVAPHEGRYVRLDAGQSRTEFLLLSIPVESIFFWSGPSNGGKTYNLKKIALEIGYYPEDLPGMIRDILKKEKSRDKKVIVYPIVPNSIQDWFISLLYFNWINWPNNKHVRHRDEELIIPWTGRFRLGEQVLRTTVDGLRIPYEEKYDLPELSPPDINNCSRLEILYQPSALEYFFPYLNERELLSVEEISYMQSLQKIVVNNQEHIKAFANEVKEEGLPGGIYNEKSTAHVTCYSDNKRLTSFTIYDDRAIITDKEQCIRYSLGLSSLRKLTTQIEPFQLRLECGDNLRNLWSLLRFLYVNRKTYPASKWNADIIGDHRASDISTESKMNCFKCPAMDDGKCHYAMNPNCQPNSPGDMVLLFETKAGWNQHGGEELFTFANHDPKGGCVLLNDGTVKFIRTKDELHALRWKE